MYFLNFNMTDGMLADKSIELNKFQIFKNS